MQINLSAPLSGKKLLSSSAIYTAGDFITTLVSGFLLIPLYLRYMKPAEYGLYSTVTVMISTLGVLMSVGISSAVGRFYFIYRESGEEYAYLGSVWLFQTIVALVMGGALVVWGRPVWMAIAPEIPFRPYIWFVLGGAVISFSAFIYSLWLRVQEKPLGFVVLQVVGTVSFMGFLGIFLVLMGKGAYGALMATLCSSALLAILSVVFLARKTVWTIKPAFVKPSLVFGGWMVVGTFGYFLLNKSQLFFLQHYGNLATVGIYNLGQQLGGILTLLAISFAKAWQPFIFSAQTSEQASFSIAQTSKFFVAIMLFGMLGIAVLSNEILHILARPEYFGSGVIIRLVAIASFIYVLGTLTNTALLYQKRAGLTQVTVLVSAGLNLLLNVLLIPRLQMVGAALAMLLSFTVMVLLGYFLSQKALHVKYDWAALSKIVGIGATLLTLEWLLVPQAASLGACAVRVALLLAYPVLLLLIGAFTASERDAAKSLAAQALALVPLPRWLGNR